MPRITCVRQGRARTVNTHAAVICETKSPQRLSSCLTLPGYDLYETPGCPTPGRNTGKWGVIVAIRRGLFTVTELSLPPALSSRAVAVDLIIPTSNGGSFTHRLLGLYAPWDPGTSFDDNFWPAVSELCLSAPFSWSASGDFNATLSTLETTSTSSQPLRSRLSYSSFLANSQAVDLWSTQGGADLMAHYTYRAYNNLPGIPTHRSIIDRTCTSRLGIVSGMIETLTTFIPCTDH